MRLPDRELHFTDLEKCTIYEELDTPDGGIVDLRLTGWWRFEGDDDDIVIHHMEVVREDTEMLLDLAEDPAQADRWAEALEQVIIGRL